MTPIHFWLDSNFFPKIEFSDFAHVIWFVLKNGSKFGKSDLFSIFWSTSSIRSVATKWQPFSKIRKFLFLFEKRVFEFGAHFLIRQQCWIENSKNWFHLDLRYFRYFDPFRVTSGFVAKFGKIRLFRILGKKFESNLWGNIYE